MLTPSFSQEFDRQYGERLRSRVEGLLQSSTSYHHEISPELKIDSQNGRIWFTNPYQFWPNNKKEAYSASEACEIIKQHVWTWLDYCMWPEEERAKIVVGLEAFLEQKNLVK